jgi:hypothetical protein
MAKAQKVKYLHQNQKIWYVDCCFSKKALDREKLTQYDKACRARRFDFDKSGAYHGVLRCISGRI